MPPAAVIPMDTQRLEQARSSLPGRPDRGHGDGDGDVVRVVAEQAPGSTVRRSGGHGVPALERERGVRKRRALHCYPFRDLVLVDNLNPEAAVLHVVGEVATQWRPGLVSEPTALAEKFSEGRAGPGLGTRATRGQHSARWIRQIGQQLRGKRSIAINARCNPHPNQPRLVHETHGENPPGLARPERTRRGAPRRSSSSTRGHPDEAGLVDRAAAKTRPPQQPRPTKQQPRSEA